MSGSLASPAAMVETWNEGIPSASMSVELTRRVWTSKSPSTVVSARQTNRNWSCAGS